MEQAGMGKGRSSTTFTPRYCQMADPRSVDLARLSPPRRRIGRIAGTPSLPRIRTPPIGLAAIVAIGLCLWIGSASAATAGYDAATLEADQAAVNAIGQRIEQKTLTGAEIPRLIDRIGKYRSGAADCIRPAQAQSSRIASRIAALGPAAAGESPLEMESRASLAREQGQAKLLLANCRLLAVTSDEMLGRLQHLQETAATNRLLQPSAPTLEILRRWLSEPPAPESLFDAQRLSRRLGTGNGAPLGWLGALGLLGLIGGSIWRRRLAKVAPIDPKQDLSRAVFQAIGLSLNRYLPGLLVSALWSLYWLIAGPGEAGWPLLADLGFALLGYQLALVAIRATFNPLAPGKPYLPFNRTLACRFAFALHSLALISLAGVLLFATPIAEASAPPLVLVARSLWTSLLVLNLVWTIGLIRRLRGKQGVGLFRLIFTLGLVAGLVAEWAGYRNLSAFVVGGIVQTLLCLLLAWLVATLGRDLLDSLDQGRRPWERRLRFRLGVGEGEPIPGLFWLRILLRILIWGALILALLELWGLPSSAESTLLGWLTQGFRIGPATIEPLRALFALVTLALLLSLGSWGRTRLDGHLSSGHMERGAREAAVAIAGYGTSIAAALIALSIAGVTFQSIAIVAGALSVGIGFGLQNVVNNFVSGLILLFERPIRTGDWIAVGSVEGYVRRISIRSTQIQTFDRADVIVPNSDLISGTVTNWMLRDSYGRVRVPVGVAYGSDTQAVKEVLLRLAREHPQIVQGARGVPDPYVLFLSFGDSSLNFELRAFVRNVDQRLSVLSDLNFAIDSAFREAGIEVPFPQRDVHLHWSKDSAPAGLAAATPLSGKRG